MERGAEGCCSSAPPDALPGRPSRPVATWPRLLLPRLRSPPGGGDPYLEGKAWLARFYADHVLASAPSRLAAVTAGADALAALTPELMGAA